MPSPGDAERAARPEAPRSQTRCSSQTASPEPILGQQTDPPTPDAPTWLELVEREAEAGAAYYALGRTHGFAEGWQAAQEAAQGRRWAAQVARAGVEAVDTLDARQRAAERQREIAARWSA